MTCIYIYIYKIVPLRGFMLYLCYAQNLYGSFGLREMEGEGE